MICAGTPQAQFVFTSRHTYLQIITKAVVLAIQQRLADIRAYTTNMIEGTGRYPKSS
jgi:hypothetical protein